MIKHRDKQIRKLRKSHFVVAEKLYKKFRNRVVSENQKSKIQYYDSYFQQNKGNMKNLWTGINEITSTKSKSSLQTTSLLIVGGKTYDDLQQMATIFNNFFVNVHNHVCSKIPRTKKSPLDYLKQRTTDSIFLQQIIYTETEDIISCLQNGKSTGPFSIPLKLLKLLYPYISKQLAHIFTHSNCISIFPDRLKYAKVLPIRKKGPPLIYPTIDLCHSSLSLAKFLRN